MNSKKKIIIASLPDDLIVEILSQVPFKSFCRFKCVCKAWLAFSSDPYYHQKLPKKSTGLLYHGQYGSFIHLISMSGNGEAIDGALRFIPQYKKLELVDCCNGLVLCRYKSWFTSQGTRRFIVCNPATEEWMELPVLNIPYGPHVSSYTAFLAYDPSWSAQFYVFNFQQKLVNTSRVVNKLEVFSPDLSTWLVDDTWSGNQSIFVNERHNFTKGVLHVQTMCDEIVVFEGLEAMSFGKSPYHHTIKLPGDCRDGCFGQSAGFLQCAFPEKDGGAIVVFSLDAHRPCKWSIKHRLCMRDVFGTDNSLLKGEYLSWLHDYSIVALDLEREVLVLFRKETNNLLSYNIGTGKLSEIKDGQLDEQWDCYCYAACYSKVPGLSRLFHVTEQ
ncbi:hypothetical protein VPH35_011362 [Triticum aestivum]